MTAPASRRSLSDAAAEGKRDTRGGCTKRQATWFRHQLRDWAWVAPDEAGRLVFESTLHGVNKTTPAFSATRATQRGWPAAGRCATQLDERVDPEVGTPRRKPSEINHLLGGGRRCSDGQHQK